MKQARDKRASAIWLHVRDDNPGAIKLYQELGFQEIARRTTWQSEPDSRLSSPNTDIKIVPRYPRFWTQQQDWLRRLYPDALGWYHSWNTNALRPGVFSWLYLLFVEFNIKQWAAVRDEKLLATLTWMPQGNRSESLYAATGMATDPDALTLLLIHARRTISYYSQLTLEYPAGELTEAISAAGFKPRRTLVWMRA
jgi:hypothetical protein